MTITIQLHCPSTNKTASGFVISPFQTTDQILQGIRLCLGIPFAALYTVDAKHVSDPHSFDDEQRVLVAAHAEEKMLPDAPGGYVLYAGEERAKLNLDGEGEGDEQAWEVSRSVVCFSFPTPIPAALPGKRGEEREPEKGRHRVRYTHEEGASEPEF